MTEAATILVVDDQDEVRLLLQDYLESKGFCVHTATSGNELRTALPQLQPALVLLDVGLPGEDGLSLARYIREQFDIGIIMVSAAGDMLDRVVGLEVGADDYIAKPFELRELLARVKSVLRRYPAAGTGTGVTQDAHPNVTPASSPSLCHPFGRCTLDLERHQLLDEAGNEVPVTAMEYDLMRVFVERPHRPRDWDPNDRSIDIRITRLRKKIEPDPEKPTVIKTVRGVGYLYNPEF